jgi:tetratricopeptide (TPR) repeat protein
LGDFYNIQLSANRNLDVISPEAYLVLREKVANNYLRAAQLGYNDPAVNRWLGKYYQENGQLKLAKQYYQMNIDSNAEDPATHGALAGIYLSEKKFTQAYNNAIKALQNFSALDARSRYKATRMAALSLYSLGEEARFLDYIKECIQLFPDIQDAYIDLLAYYEKSDDPANSEKIIRRMLLNNPYDEKGYKHLEKYCVKRLDYAFGEELFEEMMMLFEHSDEAMGNIYRFRGNLQFYQGFTEEAKKLWEISRSYFSRYLPEDSPVIKQIGDISRESSLK